jgi:RNA polymerase sigma-70 factor, ECF subfamily
MPPSISAPSLIPPGSSSTSLTLIERAKALDPDAWRRLVQLYQPILFRWCLRAGVSVDVAGDVTQDVWMAVWRNLPTFRRDRPTDTFRGWLRTILRRKLIDHWDKSDLSPVGGTDWRRLLEQVLAKLQDSDEQNTSDKVLLIRNALELVRAEFESPTWLAFWRTTVDGLTSAVVGKQLEMNPHAVIQAKSRVRKRVKEVLKDILD